MHEAPSDVGRQDPVQSEQEPEMQVILRRSVLHFGYSKGLPDPEWNRSPPGSIEQKGGMTEPIMDSSADVSGSERDTAAASHSACVSMLLQAPDVTTT